MKSEPVTWVLSDLHKSTQFEHLLSALQKQGVRLSFVLINMQETQFSTFLKKTGFAVTDVRYRGYQDLFVAIRDCRKHFRDHSTRVVHCHLLTANMVGLLAGKLSGVPKRIYTRHHSTFHHRYHRKGVWIDRLMNRLATKIVSISPGVSKVLMDMEGVSEHKVTMIPHGFDFDYFHPDPHRSVNAEKPVIGVVSRFIEWKGVQYTIQAFSKLLTHYPKAILKLYGGSGPFRKELMILLETHCPENFELIETCDDIRKAYAEMDVYVHVPVDPLVEAYGQTYVEASAMEVPSVFTLSGIAHEFVTHEKNALVVDYKDQAGIFEGIKQLLDHPDMGNQLGQQARKDVQTRFGLARQVDQLLTPYR